MIPILTFLQDVIAFTNQFFPHPIALLRNYHFTPSNLVIKPSLSSRQHLLKTIDILSYNVNNEAAYDEKKRRRILRAIFSSKAHIILLQETNSTWEKLLRDDAVRLNFVHSYFHHPGQNDRKAGGSAILSQFPLDAEKIEMFDFSDQTSGSVFPAVLCCVSIPVEMFPVEQHLKGSDAISFVTITVANVHLRPPVNLDGSAWLDTARKTEPIRICEVKELINRSQKSKRMIDIIAGDFNEGDNGGAIRYLIKEGFKNAVSRYVPRSKETHRWDFFRSFWQLRKRLDHILWRGNASLSRSENNKFTLDCINCGVLSGYENGASDHQPILSRFAIIKEM